MQTFLPNPTFASSAQALDYRRLGNQRNETHQILSTLLGVTLENTYRFDRVGTQIVYYDDADCEVEIEDMLPNKSYTRVMEPRLKRIELSSSEWRVVPYEKAAWANHPATNMWRGYEWSLLNYQLAIVKEWRRRGYIDNVLAKSVKLYFSVRSSEKNEDPPWLGNKAFHRSHRSNLVRKNPGYYGPIFTNVPDNLEYVWPSSGRE